MPAVVSLRREEEGERHAPPGGRQGDHPCPGLAIEAPVLSTPARREDKRQQKDQADEAILERRIEDGVREGPHAEAVSTTAIGPSAEHAGQVDEGRFQD